MRNVLCELPMKFLRHVEESTLPPPSRNSYSTDLFPHLQVVHEKLFQFSSLSKEDPSLDERGVLLILLILSQNLKHCQDFQRSLAKKG